MKPIYLSLFVAACASAGPLPATPDPGPFDPAQDPAWTLTFEDEFDGPVNEEIWDFQLGPRKDSVRVRDNAFTQDGYLILRTSKVAEVYETGFLRTRRKSKLLFAQRFGVFEARMKLDTAPGQWAAFWLMPKGTIHNKDGSGRDGTEIDIVEGFGRDPNSGVSQAIHFDGYGKLKQQSRTHYHMMPGAVETWRTYSVKWCPGSYTWYVDGVETWRLTDPNVISQAEQYLQLTTEVVLGSEWAGQMQDARLPADTQVDYVRVYALAETPAAQAACAVDTPGPS
ncbi:MAG: glycoside hydrolase family 16 protein [Pseudomonadota bacterium]